MRIAAFSLALMTMSVGAASADAPQFRRSTPYAEARETFRRLGYRPYTMPGADICGTDDPRCFPEIENCVKSRTFACTYTWRRGKAIIEVETRYAVPVVARAECVVNCTRLSEQKANVVRGRATALNP